MDLIRGPFPGWNIALVWLVIGLSLLIHVLLLKRSERTLPKIVELALMYQLGIGGFSGIVSGTLHIFFGEALAHFIGWPADNPFQMEVGFASIAIGTLGYLCFWRRDFWLPATLARVIFGWGAGITHVVEIVREGNFAPGNAGPILYADFLAPSLLVALLILHRRFENAKASAEREQEESLPEAGTRTRRHGPG